MIKAHSKSNCEGGITLKCPRCNGKVKRKSAKKPGGINQYYCTSCHRKYIIDQVKGGLKEV